MQKNSIMLLEKYDDAAIQAIYKVALDICSIETDQIAKLTVDVQSFCNIVACQFQKNLNEGDRKRQLKYAEDGVHFARQFKRKCLPSTDECTAIPIKSICEQENADLVFVKDKKATNIGHFN
ncbi:hypothetical protein RMATCC62417_02255 [Rhizopus microsporus]|nr:hypothetical protein RMATCC62417_02255 [Rhizopus microsporus]